MATEFRHIVRISGKDLDGNKKIIAALADLKGIGFNLSSTLLNILKIDTRTRMGSISDREVSEIESALNDLSKTGVPEWALNRRKDIETGSNFHKLGSDLDFVTKKDIDREKDSGSWKGVRHTYGLKVRGQRTRTSGRKGKTIGVKKADLKPVTRER